MGRRKRDIGDEEERILRTFLADAFQKHSNSISPSTFISNYMSCDSKNLLETCMERLVCEYKHPKTQMDDNERRVTE
ncbi:Uncharacterized protein FKW44_000019, partial [Caligus rogercresseyi]